MNKQEAVTHFGSQVLLAKALGMSQGSVSLWGEYPPVLRQLQIQAITGGKLKAEPDCLPAPIKTPRKVANA